MPLVKLQGEREKKAGIYYEVDATIDPIGEGGTGKVYEGRCVNERTGESRPVAIKFMFSDLSQQTLERARREASIQLRNDNLVEMLGFIETETEVNNKVQKHYHVVSELLNGVSLSDIFNGRCTDRQGHEIPYARKLLDTYSKDPEHFAKIIIMNVLSGIMALHDAGYIHRDIDPSNIMITDDDHIKLIDFGICKQVNNLTTHDKVQTVAGVFMGKPEYASPELALGDIDHQNQTTDIYAIGVLLYQCIKGHVPFQGKRIDILDRQVKERIPAGDIKDKRLRRIVEKACEKKQELRYQTSAEMRVDLESLDVKRAADPRRHRVLIIASVLLLLLCAGGAIGMMLYRNSKEEEQIRLRQKKTADSLIYIVTTSASQARTHAQKGLEHDEEYDKELVLSKRLYDRADSAVRQLPEGSAVDDYSADKQALIEALHKAHDELEQKARSLEDDPDPVVVEESKVIFERIKEIENVMNTP